MGILVVGCGDWGRNHVRNFHALGALAAVCEPNPERLARAEAIAPGVRAYRDLATALRDPDVDAVVVATPGETHAELSLKALDADKDVLCEKPLALRYDDAKRVADRAAARSRVLMAGHILEYHPAILELRRLVAQGQLGKVRYIYSNRLNLGKIARVENILWSFAPHDIAVILRLVGDMPFQVIAAGGAYIQPNIADVTVSHLLFEDGRAAHIFVSWLNPFKEQRLVVVGSKRMATFDDVNKELVLHDLRVDIEEGEPVPVRGEGTAVPYSSEEPLRCECRAFLEAIHARRPPLTDADSALRVLRVLQALQRSLITHGQPVALPLG